MGGKQLTPQKFETQIRIFFETMTVSKLFRKCHLQLAILSSRQSHQNSSKNIISSKVPSIQIPRIPLPNFIWNEGCANHSDKIAIEDVLTSRQYTYKEAATASRRFGRALLSQGFQKDDVMGILLPNCSSYILGLLGAMEAGLTVTTLNPAYTMPEVARQLEMSKAKIILTEESRVQAVKEAMKQIGKSMTIIVVSGGAENPGLLSMDHMIESEENGDPFEVLDFDFENDVALLPYSSGTTGLPKGVQLTHQNLVANMSQMIIPKEELDFIKPATETFQPSTVCVLPLFHIFGSFVTSLPTMQVGGKVSFLPAFEPTSFLKALQTRKPTFMHFAPPLVHFCAYSPDVTAAHLESIKYVMIGAAPVGEALANKFKEKAPDCQFREGWGMTELSPVATMTPSSDEVLGSCGVLLPNSEAKVVDVTTGEALGPDQHGEICIKGPQVMKGYLDNEEATKSTLTQDGWLHSGDIGYYDQSHRFYIVDRLKELIKVKGFQVAPAELEDLLRLNKKYRTWR